MRQKNFHVRGVAPALMQCDRLANPLDPLTIELKKLTGQRKKTEEIYRQIAELEFKANLYYDEATGPYWPAQNIDRMFKDAATMSRRGKDVIRGIMCLDEKNALLYDGPRTPDKLWKDGRFTDMRSVVVMRAKTIRCRPIFRNWECKFSIAYDEDIFNEEAVGDIAGAAGRYIGLSMYRPRFGRFEVLS